MLKQDSLTTYERLRPAAENLYLSLLDRFPDVVGSLLVQKILKSHESSVFGNDKVGDGIVGSIRNAPSRMHACKIDGVYLAIGLNAYALNQHLNYGTWFMNRLVPVLTYSVNTTPELLWRVQPRRVAVAKVWHDDCPAARAVDDWLCLR